MADEKPSSSQQAEEEEEVEEEEYVVEKIIDHREIKKGVLEYFLKWKGFPNEENTWEPADNLNCEDLIQEYENARAKKEKLAKSVKGSVQEVKKKRKLVDESNAKKKRRRDKKTNGFDKGMTAEEILGATETRGEVHFLIKWKGVNDAELVPAKVANIKIPQMVIAFYAARLTWSSADNKSTDEADGGEENGVDEEGDKENRDEAAADNSIETVEEVAAAN